MKVKKNHRKKTYKYKINRKRLRNKIFSVGKVSCKEVKEAWEKKKSVKTNLKEMGLAYDPNEALPIPNLKDEYKKKLRNNDKLEEEIVKEDKKPVKLYVAEKLEAEAKAPRVKMLQLPKSQVEWITYLLNKYKSDYKAMARDERNYYQETWKQIRAKVRMFKKIPEQFNKYLKEKGLTEKDLQDTMMDEDE